MNAEIKPDGTTEQLPAIECDCKARAELKALRNAAQAIDDLRNKSYPWLPRWKPLLPLLQNLLDALHPKEPT